MPGFPARSAQGRLAVDHSGTPRAGMMDVLELQRCRPAMRYVKYAILGPGCQTLVQIVTGATIDRSVWVVHVRGPLRDVGHCGCMACMTAVNPGLAAPSRFWMPKPAVSSLSRSSYRQTPQRSTVRSCLIAAGT